MQITGYENNQLILKEFGMRVRDNRIAANYSQAEMAEQSGVALSTLSRIEKGEGATLENVLNILRALDCLANVELLIPDVSVSPIEMADRKEKRKRASRNRKHAVNQAWVWGEDKR